MNRIQEFIDTFIPKNVSKKKRSLLKTELENHLLDKIDYYKAIGYSEAESTEKAMVDFGTDENMKKSIFKEFEELYSERSIYGILAFIAIHLMNWLCWPLDIWVTSADFNHDPDPSGALISFFMIFSVCAAILFARVKKYRKMLISIGAACSLLAVTYIFSFYTQAAAFSISSNLIYIVDVFTPFYIGNLLLDKSLDAVLAMSFWLAFLVIPAIYCFAASVRIKRGAAKDVRNPKKRAAIFSAVFAVFSVATCAVLPTSQDYIEFYPVWFDKYDNYISEDPENLFENIAIGDSYDEVRKMLTAQGYTNITGFRMTLDRQQLKLFNGRLKAFDFDEGYELWFNPEKHIPGNGFVGLKSENGVITAKGIGNLRKAMYDAGDYNNFGYSGIAFELNDDMPAMAEYFESLEPGGAESEIMNRFGSEFGRIYSKRFSLENGVRKNYYRIFCYGEVNPEAKLNYDRYGSRYIELSFENGGLTKGAIYSRQNSGKKEYVSAKYVG